MSDEKAPKEKKKFRLVEEPMNDAQITELFIFAGGMVGVAVGVLTEKIGLMLLLGVAFGFLSSMLYRAFRKK